MTDNDKELIRKTILKLMPYCAKIHISGQEFGGQKFYHYIEGIDLNQPDTIIAERVALGYDEFKLVLRPMSQFTEEIEHNGEKFIPCQKLMLNHDGSNDESIDAWFMDGNIGTEDIFFIVDKLCEWHFDIYGLIDKELALPMG